MKNMKLSLRIGLGFASLIVLMLLLGAMAWWNMNHAKEDSLRLAEAYVPEVSVSNDVERNTADLMYALRGYGYSEEAHFLELGQESLEVVREKLAESLKLADQQNLPQLKEQTAVASRSIEEYARLVKNTQAAIERLKEHRHRMDRAAGAFSKSIVDFLKDQDQRLSEEVAQLNAASADTAAMSAAIAERVRKIRLVNDILDVGNGARVSNFRSQASRDPAIMRSAISSFSGMFGIISEVRKITYLEKDLARLTEIERSAQDYRLALETFLADWENLQKLNVQRTEVGTVSLQAARATALTGMQHTEALSQESADKLSTAATVLLWGMLIAVGLGIGSAILITSGITKSIRGIILGLQEGSDQVASASQQVSSASQSLAEGASQQAAGIEETSSSLEELSSMTAQNADNAREANQVMTDTAQVVKKANAVIGQLNESMKEISTASAETQKIVKTIDEIAFQTNILALNAAVEAARAGEAGAGFAVVADEVRSLAMRAAEAAKTTADLIEGSVRKIAAGTRFVDETNQAFAQVSGASERVGGLISSIANASDEQSRGLMQINTAVAEMDKVVQNNASSAEESASASEEMNAQAEQMRDMVGELVSLVEGTNHSNGMHPANHLQLRSNHRKAPSGFLDEPGEPSFSTHSFQQKHKGPAKKFLKH
jgi:methyl-accepting chemotaxis protein